MTNSADLLKFTLVPGLAELLWGSGVHERWQEFLAENHFELVTCADLAKTQERLLDEFCRVEDVRAELERRARQTQLSQGVTMHVWDVCDPCQNDTDGEQGQE